MKKITLVFNDENAPRKVKEIDDKGVGLEIVAAVNNYASLKCIFVDGEGRRDVYNPSGKFLFGVPKI